MQYETKPTVKVIEATRCNGVTLWTLQLRYHRIIHGEFMTHRVFCLAGDAKLTFDLPAGTARGHRRGHEMRLEDFVNQWHQGSAPRRPSRFQPKDVSWVDPSIVYSAKQLAQGLGMGSPSNLRGDCRRGTLRTVNPFKSKVEDHLVLGQDFLDYWQNRELQEHRFSLRSRLQDMQIRQLNETTQKIQTSRVKDCCYSGVKPVYELRLQGGKTLAATLDHQIMTAEGWKKLGDIIPGVDQVVVSARRAKKSEGEHLDPKRHKKLGNRWRSTWQNQVRQEVIDRQQGRCQVCQGVFQGEKPHLHHLVPVSEAPDRAFDLTNVVAVHQQCHLELHQENPMQILRGGTYLKSELAEVVAVVFRGEEMTYDLEIEGDYPNFLANGIVVHNCRNASSSRAIPIQRMVKNATAMPLQWGSNRPGMQAGAELTGWRLWAAKKLWRLGMAFTSRLSLTLAKIGLHKQLANRWTETSQWIDVIVTATEWDNFFLLRDHEKAQPEIAALAQEIRYAMGWAGHPGYKEVREVQSGDRSNIWNWHLPYVTFEEREAAVRLKYDSRSLWHNCLYLAKISSARCARISYANHDGSAPILSKDYKLFMDLTSDPKVMHLSPTEHQAYPMPAPWQWSKNLRGFRQHRELLEKPGYDE